MDNWKLQYLGEQLQKSANKKYQLPLTGLFLYDQDLLHYQSKTEFSIGEYRIDIYYKNEKIAIEIDEPFHLRNKEEDKKREDKIRIEIPEITFFRIDISRNDWFAQFLKIKEEIKKNKPQVWNESGIVDGFNKIERINTQEIGEQIKSIAKYLYGSNATMTAPDRYSGVYLNEGSNTSGNYYIAVVCYQDDVTELQAKISFVVFDKLTILQHENNLVENNNWIKTKRSIDCLVKYFIINEDYLNKDKENQFLALKEFIVNQFNEIDSLNPKIKKNSAQIPV